MTSTQNLHYLTDHGFRNLFGVFQEFETVLKEDLISLLFKTPTFENGLHGWKEHHNPFVSLIDRRRLPQQVSYPTVERCDAVFHSFYGIFDTLAKIFRISESSSLTSLEAFSKTISARYIQDRTGVDYGCSFSFSPEATLYLLEQIASESTLRRTRSNSITNIFKKIILQSRERVSGEKGKPINIAYTTSVTSPPVLDLTYEFSSRLLHFNDSLETFSINSDVTQKSSAGEFLREQLSMGKQRSYLRLLNPIEQGRWLLEQFVSLPLSYSYSLNFNLYDANEWIQQHDKFRKLSMQNLSPYLGGGSNRAAQSCRIAFGLVADFFDKAARYAHQEREWKVFPHLFRNPELKNSDVLDTLSFLYNNIHPDYSESIEDQSIDGCEVYINNPDKLLSFFRDPILGDWISQQTTEKGAIIIKKICVIAEEILKKPPKEAHTQNFFLNYVQPQILNLTLTTS